MNSVLDKLLWVVHLMAFVVVAAGFLAGAAFIMIVSWGLAVIGFADYGVGAGLGGVLFATCLTGWLVFMGCLCAEAMWEEWQGSHIPSGGRRWR